MIRLLRMTDQFLHGTGNFAVEAPPRGRLTWLVIFVVVFGLVYGAVMGCYGGIIGDRDRSSEAVCWSGLPGSVGRATSRSSRSDR